MSLSKKKQKKSTDQPCIDKLDELLWESTPLGKFQKSNKEEIQNSLPFPTTNNSKPRKYKPRIWVIRVPSVFVDDESKHGGYQTLVNAVTAGHALEKAAESFSWEPLDFKVAYLRVFPKDPAEDI